MSASKAIEKRNERCATKPLEEREHSLYFEIVIRIECLDNRKVCVDGLCTKVCENSFETTLPELREMITPCGGKYLLKKCAECTRKVAFCRECLTNVQKKHHDKRGICKLCWLEDYEDPTVPMR